jgi:ribosomal protein S9
MRRPLPSMAGRRKQAIARARALQGGLVTNHKPTPVALPKTMAGVAEKIQAKRPTEKKDLES